MPFQIVYKPLAQIEVAEAYAWYAQPELGMGQGAPAEHFADTKNAAQKQQTRLLAGLS